MRPCFGANPLVGTSAHGATGVRANTDTQQFQRSLSLEGVKPDSSVFGPLFH